LLASIGGALEFYDFIIFIFFTSVIAKIFFPPSLPDWIREIQTFGIFAAGYFARPIGGIILAHFGELQKLNCADDLEHSPCRINLITLQRLTTTTLPTYTLTRCILTRRMVCV
jgi:hypothetical protein